ncbi:MAG: threonine--tRNA ligase [Alphaproteobacteria bacterium]|nr:threonine--tRNA ligase [Alphaproteobacteria bacterium]
MIVITLPGGISCQFDKPITGKEVAIAQKQIKTALALKINGVIKDLDTLLDKNSSIEFVTAEYPEALELLRHDCAHVLAEAVQELFPGTQITFGPATETGFYYDFVRDVPFTPDDFPVIEKKMREIVDRNEKITREVVSRKEAIDFFTKKGESFKAEHIASIPEDEEITLYTQGNFTDLCTGPHLPTTSKLGKAFKLMKVAGAYWRGDPKNPKLQRIYGTCWATQAQLDQYLTMLAEAEKRDHRRLGREMGLFHQQEEATGSIFWHPKGWVLYRLLENYIRNKIINNGYVEVKTPLVIDRSLWEASGHWDNFKDNMFFMHSEERALALKPMNCPAHIQIFRQGITSYRDLPLRLSEFGTCHRNEPSGSLHGIMRTRAFTQDDAHIFCTEDQVTEETKKFCHLLLQVYKELGFDKIVVKFADRPVNRIGSDEDWDKAENSLKKAVDDLGMDYQISKGEGAFYGPKLEFHLQDTLGRSWQCGTLQLDPLMPQRLQAVYIGSDGQKHHPIMLHRAILGSLERFIGILLEHYAGKLPLWLAPVQVIVTTITDEAKDYAYEVLELLKNQGIRCDLDIRNEKISYKIREHSLTKTPILFILGKREKEERMVALRQLGEEKGQEVLTLDETLSWLKIITKMPNSLV